MLVFSLSLASLGPGAGGEELPPRVRFCFVFRGPGGSDRSSGLPGPVQGPQGSPWELQEGSGGCFRGPRDPFSGPVWSPGSVFWLSEEVEGGPQAPFARTFFTLGSSGCAEGCNANFGTIAASNFDGKFAFLHTSAVFGVRKGVTRFSGRSLPPLSSGS